MSAPRPTTPGTFGDRLRNARKRRRMTQADLSSRSGVAQAYISQLEVGRTASPQEAMAQKLAKALGVPVAELITNGKGKP